MDSAQNFGNSDNEEYIEEEMLIYVDVEPTSLSSNQVREASCFKIFGNEKKAIIQIDNKFYEGKYDYSMGTHVFFERDDESPVDPLYTKCEKFYRFDSKTNKMLKMDRVILKDAKTDENVLLSQPESDESELRVTRTYEHALNLLLPDGSLPPRRIVEEEDCLSLEMLNENMSNEDRLSQGDDMELST